MDKIIILGQSIQWHRLHMTVAVNQKHTDAVVHQCSSLSKATVFLKPTFSVTFNSTSQASLFDQLSEEDWFLIKSTLLTWDFIKGYIEICFKLLCRYSFVSFFCRFILFFYIYKLMSEAFVCTVKHNLNISCFLLLNHGMVLHIIKIS